MSKKMLKRSLALGALMAFVITGSAMAGNMYDFNENKEQTLDVDIIYTENDLTNKGVDLTSADEKTHPDFAIYHTKGILTIDGKTLENIDKVSNGNGGSNNGAVICSRSTAEKLIIQNSFVRNNTHTGSSKPYAVIDISTSADIINTQFIGNETGYMGGALYLHNKNFKIENSQFVNNTAALGAAIQAINATITLKGENTFNGNVSTKEGGDSGAAINVQSGTIDFEGKTTFEANKAMNGNGGAIHNYYENATMNFKKDSETIFINNEAKLDGGAIYNNNTAVLEFAGSAEFTNNKAGGEGGAIYNISTVNFNDGSTTTFTGNTASGVANDIHNDGIVNINKGAVVNLDGGMDGTGIVNIAGTLNGKITATGDSANSVNFSDGGLWNLNGDSTVTKLEGVVNVNGEGKELNVINKNGVAIDNKVVKDSKPIGYINVAKLYAEASGNAISSYGDLTVAANEIGLKAGSNGIYLEDSGSEVIINTNKLTINADGNGINVNRSEDTLEIIGTGDNSVVSITAGGNGIVTRNSYDADGGYNHKVTVSADTVNITSTGVDEIERYDKGNAVLAQGKDSVVSVDGDTVNITSGKDGVTALKGASAVLTGNNITIDVDAADGYDSYVYGVHAGERSIGNGNVTIGTEETSSVIIDVKGKDATGIFARAYNNSGKEEDQSTVVVKGNKLDITVAGEGANSFGVWAASGTETKNAPSSAVILETVDTKINAGEGTAIVSYSNGTVDVKGNLEIDAKNAVETRGYAKTIINANNDKSVKIDGDILFTKEYDYAEGDGDNQIRTDANVTLNLSKADSYLNGNIYVSNFDSVVNNKATYKDITGMALGISNGAYWATQTGDDVDNFVNTLTMSNGIIKHNNNGNITVNNYSGNGTVELGSNGHIHIDAGSGSLNLTEKGFNADSLVDLSDDEVTAKFNTIAGKLGVKEEAKGIKATVVASEGDVTGETTGEVTYAEVDDHDYYHGTVTDVTEKVNTKNQAIGEAGVSLKLHWRSHLNDMNKRMGELRMANGETGVWTRMVRGESEYEGTKAQYNQYQLGYDEKLSTDPSWTVGAAVTFAEGDSNYGTGSTEDDSTAFAIYGSKLNADGSYVDLIARYARLESDFDDVAGKGDYSTNGYSVSAEYGKRYAQGNGLWIEPQVELSYGTIDSADFKLGSKTVTVGDMDSLIGRVGFSIGKDIEKGNVYARASYLYDFEGETENAFSANGVTRTIAEDLGGGWWEVGVGANINLSKATYIYADVEKTFGGEVDTNWQWNLGVRYSF